MPLSREQVEKVSLLARLQLSEEELVLMTAQLDAIVGYIEQLGELDTEHVEPMAHPIELSDVFRPDQSRPSTERSEILATAPHADGQFYLVPAVLGD